MISFLLVGKEPPFHIPVFVLTSVSEHGSGSLGMLAIHAVTHQGDRLTPVTHVKYRHPIPLTLLHAARRYRGPQTPRGARGTRAAGVWLWSHGRSALLFAPQAGGGCPTTAYPKLDLPGCVSESAG